MLILTEEIERQIVAFLRAELPNEGCGLLAGRSDPCGDVAEVIRFVGCRNELASPVRYRMHAADQLRAELDIEADGLTTVGVVHSHPTSPAHPSATDVNEAPVAAWHYLIVSLASPEPEVGSFRIRSGAITPETIVRAG